MQRKKSPLTFSPEPDAQDASDLFTYGSLMCADIMTEVAGESLQSRPALLTGYQRFLVSGEQYPGLVARPGGQVTGIVYHGLTPASWERLDRFEGEMYERRTVVAHFQDGGEAKVACYLFRVEFAHRLTTIEWDFATFTRYGKTLFHDQYCGFKAIE